MALVGLITFHASYNFGTVMQAWSTQKIVNEYGYDCEIINFRMVSQKDKYSLIPLHNGVKTIVRDLLQIRFIGMRCQSYKKYEKFICTRLNISKEYNHCSEVKKANKYDIYLAGSDQIWSYNIPEYSYSKEDMRGVYYLDFVDGYKISYASSTGEATYEELLPYKNHLLKFNHIAVREQRGKEIIDKITGLDVEKVLDPTYLISHDEWVKITGEMKPIYDEMYVLIYSLQGRKKSRKWKKLIEGIQLKNNVKIVTILPFAPISGKGIFNRIDAGPDDILNLFAHASYIFTDTFHGMSFAIHFRKSFMLFENNIADFRKRNILSMFGLEDRETNEIQRGIDMYSVHIDYTKCEDTLYRQIKHSKMYLKNSLDCYN